MERSSKSGFASSSLGSSSAIPSHPPSETAPTSGMGSILPSLDTASPLNTSSSSLGGPLPQDTHTHKKSEGERPLRKYGSFVEMQKMKHKTIPTFSQVLGSTESGADAYSVAMSSNPRAVKTVMTTRGFVLELNLYTQIRQVLNQKHVYVSLHDIQLAMVSRVYLNLFDLHLLVPSPTLVFGKPFHMAFQYYETPY